MVKYILHTTSWGKIKERAARNVIGDRGLAAYLQVGSTVKDDDRVIQSKYISAWRLVKVGIPKAT
jgi:hypothetical protein